MDKFMYQVQLDGKLHVSTIGDYKLAFDAMNVFQRPKRTDMLGGLRSKIYDEIDRQLIVQEAKERGYMDKPGVRDEVNGQVEEMMVTKLFNDVVSFDKEITPEQVSAFYDEHAESFVVPEARKGHVLYCDDEAAGQAAAAAARNGADWDELLGQYDSNRANLDRKGETDLLRANASDPVKDALFALSDEGDVSDPFPVDEKWVVARLDEIQPAHQQSLQDATEQIGRVIRAQRQDESLKKLLAEWRGEFDVVIHQDRLAKLRSWEDLTGSSVQ
jgi:parvulin-like peptidyl-prolyl isomerase